MKHLLPLFPSILKSKHDFEDQNKLLNKVTLTGKINSDSASTNLFEFAEKTSKNFSELQNKLINILLQENIHTITNELKAKATVTIDVLIRNLFERTADVGFLATDMLIIEFLKNADIPKEKIKNHLCEYVAKYSVYNEIVVFDTTGAVKVNLNSENPISASSDPLIQETLETDSYVERYAHTDIFKKQNKTLTYTQKIVDEHNTPIGVLCLCFKFEDELQRIVNNVQTSGETILLLQDNKIIASSDMNQYKVEQPFKYIKEDYAIINSSVVVSAKTSGYQGYYGLDWSSVVLKETKHIKLDQDAQSIEHSFMNQNIRDVIQEADSIVEDLGDIIINGELIAAKRRMYVLNPILDNLRVISANMLETIKDAGNNLEQLGTQSLQFNLISSARLAIDIMDRNLYERANDSRWWALTPIFIQELSSDTPNTTELNRVLHYINSLYTVYTNLFIYDKNKKIIATSHDLSIIGKIVENSAVSNTLENKDPQKYFVSEFEKTEFYNHESTYIYHASINNSKENVGGIAVVFDSTVEFRAILDDCLTEHDDSLSLFIDADGMVISSTDSTIQTNSIFPIEKQLLDQILKNELFYGVVTINDKSYILASARSKGYREYKVSDNYKNMVISLTLLLL